MMSDIFLMRLKNKDAFLRNACLCGIAFFTERYNPMDCFLHPVRNVSLGRKMYSRREYRSIGRNVTLPSSACRRYATLDNNIMLNSTDCFLHPVRNVSFGRKMYSRREYRSVKRNVTLPSSAFRRNATLDDNVMLKYI